MRHGLAPSLPRTSPPVPARAGRGHTTTIVKPGTLTREQWLIDANKVIRQWFTEIEQPVPDKLRISCGFPANRKKFIGECWDHRASTDGTIEIFISPIIDTPIEVLSTLVHEDVHAAVGLECKHRGAFKRVALAIGLVGKMTATSAGPELETRLRALLGDLPAYPHAALRPGQGPTKTQTTRMIKATCEHEGCGYTVRLSRKWIEQVGAPHCPKHGEMACDGADSDEE